MKVWIMIPRALHGMYVTLLPCGLCSSVGTCFVTNHETFIGMGVTVDVLHIVFSKPIFTTWDEWLGCCDTLISQTCRLTFAVEKCKIWHLESF